MSKRPIANSAAPVLPRKPRALSGGAEQSPYLVFSFRFWRQIQHFSLNPKKPSWFIAVYEQLQKLSSEKRDFFEDNRKADVLRFHRVNWGQTNIPIKPSDLNWLPKDYLDQDNYPLQQFTISKALGRIAGFFDEHLVFNIVLLDPHHNLQPSSDFGYRLTWSNRQANEMDFLWAQIERIRDAQCDHEKCRIKEQLRILTLDSGSFATVFIDEAYSGAYRNLVASGFSLAEFLELKALEFDGS